MSDNIIQLNADLIHTELKDLVKNSVEETLNAMLDAEADTTWYQVPLRKCYRDMVPGTFKGTEEKAVRMTLARAVDRRSILHYNPYSSIYPE